MMIEACSPRVSTSLLRRDLTSLPVKFWSVFSYLIVYDPAAGPIAIVRVLDDAANAGPRRRADGRSRRRGRL
jgi:hypothetical protein